MRYPLLCLIIFSVIISLHAQKQVDFDPRVIPDSGIGVQGYNFLSGPLGLGTVLNGEGDQLVVKESGDPAGGITLALDNSILALDGPQIQLLPNALPDFASGVVRVIDSETGVTFSTIETGPLPLGVAVTSWGEAYVGSQNRGGLLLGGQSVALTPTFFSGGMLILTDESVVEENIRLRMEAVEMLEPLYDNGPNITFTIVDSPDLQSIEFSPESDKSIKITEVVDTPCYQGIRLEMIVPPLLSGPSIEFLEGAACGVCEDAIGEPTVGICSKGKCLNYYPIEEDGDDGMGIALLPDTPDCCEPLVGPSIEFHSNLSLEDRELSFHGGCFLPVNGVRDVADFGLGTAPQISIDGNDYYGGQFDFGHAETSQNFKLRWWYVDTPRVQIISFDPGDTLEENREFDFINRIIRWSLISANDTIKKEHDPSNHKVTITGYNERSNISTDGIAHNSVFDNTERTVAHTYQDGSDVMSQTWDLPGRQVDMDADILKLSSGTVSCSDECDFPGGLITRTCADDADEMTSEYEPSTHTMSCKDFDSWSYTSTGGMQCTTNHNDGPSSRSITRIYSDNDALVTSACLIAPGQSLLQYNNIGLRVVNHSSQLKCEYDSRGLSGQFYTETIKDQGTSGSVQLLFDPNDNSFLGSLVARPYVYVTDEFGGQANLEVSGDLHVYGELSKAGGTFRIDHPLDPENQYLQHSFVEAPERKNIYNGNIVTDDEGFATVELPDYFEALNIDFRYQLTVIGEFAQAIVKEKINNNQFLIQTDKPDVEVSWQVTGNRNDAYAQANPLQVEVDKGEDRGTRLFTDQNAMPDE